MYEGKMKMAELVDKDFHLLGFLSRVGIEGSFGEKSVNDICMSAGLDTDTFLLLCEVYSNPDLVPDEERLRRSRISDVLRYLHHSHDYYINNALVSMASAIEKLIEPCSEAGQKIIWKFFSEYRSELENHFENEEKSVIPYVQNLLIGNRPAGSSIDMFDESHSSIDEKISDLKNLIMKSLPNECNNRLRINLLSFIYHLRQDLDRHTRIEDNIMIPMVHLIEDPHRTGPSGHAHNAEQDNDSDTLSEREKEILVSVAKGMINKEIADKHNISINTVITHRKNITRKTGIKTVAGLTVYAILNNLIDVSAIKE